MTPPERPEGREAVHVYPRGASAPYVRQAVLLALEEIYGGE